MKIGAKWRKLMQNPSNLFKLDQLYVHLFLELNVINTNWYILHKEGVNQIWLRHKIGTNSDQQSQQRGSLLQNLPTMAKYGKPPSPWMALVCLKKGCIILWYNSWSHFLRYSWVHTYKYSYISTTMYSKYWIMLVAIL